RPLEVRVGTVLDHLVLAAFGIDDENRTHLAVCDVDLALRVDCNAVRNDQLPARFYFTIRAAYGHTRNSLHPTAAFLLLLLLNFQPLGRPETYVANSRNGGRVGPDKLREIQPVQDVLVSHLRLVTLVDDYWFGLLVLAENGDGAGQR